MIGRLKGRIIKTRPCALVAAIVDRIGQTLGSHGGDETKRRAPSDNHLVTFAQQLVVYDGLHVNCVAFISICFADMTQ